VSDWSWKLRLFLSADLVGSTAFKASRSGKRASEWAATFKEFFQSFPDFVESSYSDNSHKSPECEKKLKAWKFSGDEILFQVQLSRYEDVVSHIGAFKRAVGMFPDAWESKNIPLKLKATGWIAGFPVNNTEIVIPSDDSKTHDFIGPGIDLGFRLARFANTQKFILSADLALMLLDAIDRTEVMLVACFDDVTPGQMHGLVHALGDLLAESDVGVVSGQIDLARQRYQQAVALAQQLWHGFVP